MRLPQPDAFSPEDLDDGVDMLSADPSQILEWSGTDRPRAEWDYEEVDGWRQFLAQARARENEKAPPLSDYVITGIGVTAIVIGVGLTAPVTGVPALVGLWVGGAGSLATLAGAVKLVRHNNRSNTRLCIIDQAQRLLEARLLSHNAPPDS
ncbi:hypothetical protein K3718_16515 [Leisingera aquaemixtae]|uniref:Uncharacterized protein n=1 Tax=Leisingera aquaemixtae TaxID=1396826 RepID=A0ABY5WI27_9RHOB|nr:hypothetical protein [Leisingera aquaemixtae]UWQ41114.1 hypothetical protein K3718_16515 [Leisingera aquaemixtae]